MFFCTLCRVLGAYEMMFVSLTFCTLVVVLATPALVLFMVCHIIPNRQVCYSVEVVVLAGTAIPVPVVIYLSVLFF